MLQASLDLDVLHTDIGFLFFERVWWGFGVNTSSIQSKHLVRRKANKTSCRNCSHRLAIIIILSG